VPAYYAAKYLRRSGIPTVGILRSDDALCWGLMDRFVFGRKEERVSGIVCVSEFLQQRVLERRPGSVAVRKIASGTFVPSETARPPKRTLRIAYVGRLVQEHKRAPDVARALVRATKEVQGVEAILFGDGSARGEVERILKSEGPCSVRVAGKIKSEEVYKQLLDCHAIVLLSDSEGLPMSIMEGMACGCVPVCLRVRSGIPELVEDEVTGLLVHDRGESFVSAIRRLRNEAGLWERLSKAARAKIENGYSIQTCAKQWAELLGELHAKSGPKRPIEIPQRIKLGAAHPGFAHQDPRPSRVPLPVQVYRRTRIAAGRWRRMVLGQPLP
jgi:glycosyltransferase involved in cell wall biosynthesis